MNNCQCGGELKKTIWLLTTEKGLARHQLDHLLTLPVKVEQVRCPDCGHTETKHEELDP